MGVIRVPIASTLRARSFDELKAKAEGYGPSAWLVSARKIGSRNLWALIRGDRYEGLVVVPDPSEPGEWSLRIAQEMGLETIFQTAEAEDALDTLPELGPRVAAEDFAAMLQHLGAPVVMEDRGEPAPLAAPGTLILVAAPHDAALGPAMALAEAIHGELRTAGLLEAYGVASIGNRRQAAAAREEGAVNGRPIVVAFGLGRPGSTAANASAAERLGADQVWLVVDARTKHSDTASWVAAAQTHLVVNALAVVGTAETSTPRTVERLGIPVGWTDQNPLWR
ncbi:hypothetical protein SPF06_12155 [Sinomonas sp. JGH33]|uniref:Uncharacterized protein n=1 Tax=Sinomonas terricola TaxID=3110330 RepID=A0ABU5T722_9MICC|nr:hypothetical protein [Sinomonas sp. JGH33]MEA5455477.1 hypothetical protein [Sinomonas sp. JGH33]